MKYTGKGLSEAEARIVEGVTAGKKGKELLEYSGYKHSQALYAAKKRERVQLAIQAIREQRVLDLAELAAKGQKMLSSGLQTIETTGSSAEKMQSGGAAMKLVADVHGKLPTREVGYSQNDILADLEQRKRSMRLHIAFALRNPDRALRMLDQLYVTGA